MPCRTEANPPLPSIDFVDGILPLQTLYLYIAGDCNLACRHCWIDPEHRSPGADGQFLSVEHMKSALSQAKPLGLQSIKLTGGEPLLHPHFQEMVKAIASEHIEIHIETNGTLITREIATFLHRLPQVRFISVSLDGARAETHEFLRGVPGSFAEAVSGIHALVHAGFRPQLICTLHRHNVSEARKLISLAEALGCGSIKFNHVQPIGRGTQFLKKNGLPIPEWIRLHRQLLSSSRKPSGIPVFFDIPLAFHSIKSLLSGALPRCSIKNILGLLSNGDWALCGIGVSIPDLTFGRVGQDDLQRIWRHHPVLVKMRRLIPERLSGICSRCILRQHCLGSCVANNYHRSRRINAPYDFCSQAEKMGLFPRQRILPHPQKTYGRSSE